MMFSSNKLYLTGFYLCCLLILATVYFHLTGAAATMHIFEYYLWQIYAVEFVALFLLYNRGEVRKSIIATAMFKSITRTVIVLVALLWIFFIVAVLYIAFGGGEPGLF